MMGGKTQAMRAVEARPAEPAGKRWFVVQAHANQERLAKAHLVNQGFDVYLPMRLCPHPKARHPVTPFLPRYLFVRFDPSVDRWLSILSTVGVTDVFRKAGGFPQAIPDKWVTDLREKEIEGVLHLVQGLAKPPPPVFKKGDKVKITDGAFRGLQALVDVQHNNDRVVVFLGLVERAESALRMCLHTSALEGAGVR